MAKQRLHAPTKFAILFALLASGGFFGWKALSSYLVDGIKFEPIKPSKVNIVGVNPGAGFRIIVSNQIAQLTQGELGEFGVPDPDSFDSTGDRKRIPLKEMLKALEGNKEALGEFIRVMNRINESDIPENRIWDAADIRKALNGDKALVAKLQRDLSVDFDGNPMPSTSGPAIENGIGIRLSVPVQVAGPAGLRTLEGTVVFEYKPIFVSAVWERLRDKFDLSNQIVAGYYAEEAQKLAAHPERKEDVRHSLEAQISTRRSEGLAAAPQQVLSNAFVVVTDQFMEKAEYRERAYENGKRLFSLIIDLNDEGRKRLWQFSKRRVGDQLLVVSDGVAIAAPHIEHELTQAEITINKLPDEELVQEVVNLINAHGGELTQK